MFRQRHSVGIPGRRHDKRNIHLFILKHSVVNNFKVSHLICENEASFIKISCTIIAIELIIIYTIRNLERMLISTNASPTSLV